MWPDVLVDIATKIKARIAEDIGGTLPAVYLGASAGIPSVSQINIIRGNAIDSDGTTLCDGLNEMIVHVEIWVNHDTDPLGDDDEAYENARTLAGYNKLAALSQAILKDDYSDSALAYETTFVKIESDQDQFRPTVAERIEFKVELGGS